MPWKSCRAGRGARRAELQPRHLIAFLILAVPLALRAQQAPAAPQALTLEAAFERALAANPTLMAARLARPVATAGVAVAGEHPNPEISYEAARETPRQAIGTTFPIELGGKRSRRIALAEAGVAASDAEIARTIARVRNDVRRAYFEVVAANQRTGMIDDLRQLAVRARDAAQARFSAGDVPRLELLQTELALADAENEVEAARGEAAAQRAELNALLGQAADTPLTLSDVLSGTVLPTIEDILSRVTQSNTEIAVIDRRIEEQIARRDLASALRTPDLSAGGALTYDAQPEFSTGWRASVALTIPVFTTHRAGVVLEDAELSRLQAERTALVATTTGAVTAAFQRAASAREQVTRFETEVFPRLLEVERMAQDGYAAGQTGLPQLVTALQQGRDIRRRSLEAALGYQRALAELERAMGVPLR
jgi:outer membrane protein, heavy metal efflux system